MFRQFPVFKVLPNLRKQMSLICLLLPILKIYQPKRGFRFILVNMHLMKNTNYEAPFYVISSVLLLSRVYTFASWLARIKYRGCPRRNFMQVEILTCRSSVTCMKRLRAHPRDLTCASQLSSCKRGSTTYV
jgi:hypothetical protein